MNIHTYIHMVFNATFNNISVISWRSVLMVEESRENHQPASDTDKVYHIMLYRVHLGHERDSKFHNVSGGKY